jgi:hypothetical protein
LGPRPVGARCEIRLLVPRELALDEEGKGHVPQDTTVTVTVTGSSVLQGPGRLTSCGTPIRRSNGRRTSRAVVDCQVLVAFLGDAYGCGTQAGRGAGRGWSRAAGDALLPGPLHKTVADGGPISRAAMARRCFTAVMIRTFRSIDQ